MSFPSVSKVVHVRNVTEDARDELTAFARQFGAVNQVFFMPKFSQGLLEMESVEAASALLNYAHTSHTTIRGRHVVFSFSKSQSINPIASAPRIGDEPRKQEIVTAGRVLLCTILNPQFNITVDVMNTIMSRFGPVLKIVIFNKTSLQALIEFHSPQSAALAKAELQGKDIYPGSCTLRIVYS